MSSNQTAATVRSFLAPFGSHAARLCLGVRALNTAAATVLLGAGGFLAASAHWPALAYVYLAVLVAGSALSLRFEVPAVDRLLAGRDVLQLWFIVAGVMALTAVLTLALPHGFAAVIIALGMGLALRVRQAINRDWVEEFFSVYSVHQFNLVSRVLGIVCALVALLVVAVIGVVATYEFTQAAAQLGGIMVLLILSGQGIFTLLLNRRRAELLTVPLDRGVADFETEPELTWVQVADIWARPWRASVRDVALAGLFVVTLVSMTPVVAHSAGGPAALLVVTGLVVAGVVIGWCLPARAGVPALHGFSQRGALLGAAICAAVMFFAPWLVVVAVAGSIAGLLGGYVLNSALIPSNVSYLAQSMVKVAEVAAIGVLLLAAAFAAVIGQSPTVGAQVEIVIIVILVAAAMAVPFLLGWKQKQIAKNDEGATAQSPATSPRAATAKHHAPEVAPETAAVAAVGTRSTKPESQATEPMAARKVADAAVDHAAATVAFAAPESVATVADPVAADSMVMTNEPAAPEPVSAAEPPSPVADLPNRQESHPQMNTASSEPEPKPESPAPGPALADGAFIVVEGGDGAGKSTVLAALAEALEDITDQRIVVTREPGGTAAGRRLRDLLLGNIDWCSRAEALLFAADRAQHVASVIDPTLAERDIVISDRYVDSSIAYQGAGRALDPNEIESLSRWATNDLSPHLTILLDVDPEVAVTRRAQDKTRGADDRMESEALEFHVSVREFFLALAEREPERYVVLDANQPQADVVAAAVAGMLQFFGAAADSEPDSAVVIEPPAAAQPTAALSDEQWITEPIAVSAASSEPAQIARPDVPLLDQESAEPAPVTAATEPVAEVTEPASTVTSEPAEAAESTSSTTSETAEPAEPEAENPQPTKPVEDHTPAKSPMEIADEIVTGGQKIMPPTPVPPAVAEPTDSTSDSTSDEDDADDLALLWLADTPSAPDRPEDPPATPAPSAAGESWFDAETPQASPQPPVNSAEGAKEAPVDHVAEKTPVETAAPKFVEEPTVILAEPTLEVVAEPEPAPELELVADLGPEPKPEPITEVLGQVAATATPQAPTEVLAAKPEPQEPEPQESEPQEPEPTTSELLQEIARTKPETSEPTQPTQEDSSATGNAASRAQTPPVTHEPKPVTKPRIVTTPTVTAIPTSATPAVPQTPDTPPASPTNRVRIAAPQTSPTAPSGDQNVEIYGPGGVKWEAKTVPLSKYGNTASHRTTPLAAPTAPMAAPATQAWQPQTLTASQLTGATPLPEDQPAATTPAVSAPVPAVEPSAPASATLPIAAEYAQTTPVTAAPQPAPVATPEPVAPAEPAAPPTTRTHVFNPNNFAATEPEPPAPTRRARRRQRAIDLRDAPAGATTPGAPSTHEGPTLPAAATQDSQDPHSRSSQRRRRFAQAERERRERADQHYQDWFFEGDYGDNHK